MTTVFISLPMNGLSDEKVKSKQKELVEKVKKHIPNAIIADTYISEDAPKNCNIGVWYLGKSLKMLSQCDLAVFAMGWEQARGCWIEYETCKRYGIPVKFEIPDLRD